MKRMIAPLQEKLMEVPKGFLQDSELWLKKVLGSNLLYTYTKRLKTISTYKNLNDPIADEKKKQMVKNEDKYVELYQYLKDTYADNSMVKLMFSGREVSADFDLSNYPSKYGDLSKIKKSVRVKYKKQMMKRLGMYSPTTKSIALYSRILSFALRDLLGEGIINNNFHLYVYRPKLSYDWMLMDKSTIDNVIRVATTQALRTVEHEFIHLIQHFLFPDIIKDPQYTTDDLVKYYASPLEINPWLITLLSQLEVDILKERKPVTNEKLEQWIPKQQYFRILKDMDRRLYQKMVSSFYQLVDERLGITNR